VADQDDDRTERRTPQGLGDEVPADESHGGGGSS